LSWEQKCIHEIRAAGEHLWRTSSDFHAVLFFFGCADSLEDQEGGAMYISCDVSNGGPVEPETGYVPNNPLFGLALDSPQVSPGILFRFRLNISGNLRAFGCACFVERT